MGSLCDLGSMNTLVITGFLDLEKAESVMTQRLHIDGSDRISNSK